jgi:hypothetical protein
MAFKVLRVINFFLCSAFLIILNNVQQFSANSILLITICAWDVYFLQSESYRLHKWLQ